MKMNNSSIELINNTVPPLAYSQRKVIKPVSSAIKKSPITPREGECLSWHAIGKTASEIAEVLNVSEHTIHFHTKNAIKKLNASNKTHAVVLAILAKYITVS